MTARRASRAFTLIEVLIAAGLFAMVGAMTVGLFGRANALKEETERADDRYAQVRTALDRIALEVSQAFISNHYDMKRFRERPTIFKGEDEGRNDTLRFTSLSYERLVPDEKAGDVAMVTYFVDRDAEYPFDSLWRRVNPIIDVDAERRGRKAVLCENVRGFQLEYWDAVKNEWVDEWDTNSAERNGVMPERIKVELTIVDTELKERTFTTQARVMMRRALDLRN